MEGVQLQQNHPELLGFLGELCTIFGGSLDKPNLQGWELTL